MGIYTGPSLDSLPEWDDTLTPPPEWLRLKEALVALGVGGDASDIEFTPNGSISATNVQAAIQEVRDEAVSGVAGTASVATIAALTALSHTSLTNRQRVYVIAYDANGLGGGMFRWESASNAPTDGGVTFIPDSLVTAATPYSMEYGHFGNPNGFRQLPHTNIVWGSVAISIQDGAQTINSKWLHGHSIHTRHGTGGSLVGREVGLLDHALGQLWGDNGARLRCLIETNTVGGTVAAASRTASMAYSYAAGAGRWIREVGDYVTPAMFGGKPNDAAFDNSFFIAWALNWLNGQTRVKTLKFDGNYYVKGFWGEIYSNIVLKGQGKENPAITFFGDQGGGAGGVADFLKDVYIDSAQDTITNTTDPYFCMGLHFGGSVQFSNATGWSHEDMCIDGNAANNLYFLTGGAAWDVGGTESRVSQYLREGPHMTGLSVTVQSGRTVAAGTRWNMHRCTIKNMLGGCIVYANGGFMNYSDLRLGNSLSGRVLYGGQGFGRGLTIFGYTRSSFWAPYSGHFSDVIWENLVANPWTENATDPAPMAFRGESYLGEADDIGYPAIVQERYGLRHVTLSGFAMAVDVETPEIFNLQGQRWDISNGSVYGPTTGTCTVLNVSNTAITGGITGPAIKGLRYLNRSTSGPKLLNISGSGYFAKANFSDIHIQEQYDGSGIRLSDPNTFATNLTGYLMNINMDPHPGGDVPLFPKQIIELNDVYCDTMMDWLVLAEGAGSATAVPTEVHIRGGSIVNRKNKLVKSVETDVTFAAGKLKIFLTDFSFYTFDPGEANRSTADVVDPWIALAVMQNCRNQNGRVSEIDILETRTAVAGATITVTIAAPGVVSWTSHGLTAGASVQFQTTGALPTGITAGQLYYVLSTGLTADAFQISGIAGGTAITTSGSQSGTHTAAKAASERLTTITNTLTYVDIPINLLWKPLVYSAAPVSANAITRGVASVSAVYPNTTGATPDNTRPRLRIGVGTISNGDVLTYNLRAAVAPPRSLG